MYESQDRVETVQGNEVGNKGISIEESRQLYSGRKCKEAAGRKERRDQSTERWRIRKRQPRRREKEERTGNRMRPDPKDQRVKEEEEKIVKDSPDSEERDIEEDRE